MSLARSTLPPVGEIRPWHNLECPARAVPDEALGIAGVADEDIGESCRCPRDDRWLNPKARPVLESAEGRQAHARHLP